VIVAFEGNRAGELSFVSGSLDESGYFDAEAFSMNDNRARRGKNPTAAFDRTGTVNVLFETPADRSFRYVRGALRSGRFVSEVQPLTINMERR
jgi:hypothetical protein